jgi:hypothetical protein
MVLISAGYHSIAYQPPQRISSVVNEGSRKGVYPLGNHQVCTGTGLVPRSGSWVTGFHIEALLTFTELHLDAHAFPQARGK